MLQPQHPHVPPQRVWPGVVAAQTAKAATLERLRRLKSRLVLATLLGFGAFGGLAAGHRAGAATPATPPASATTQAPAPSSGSDDQGGFFSQGGSGDQGGYGYGFGSGNNPQPPVAGSGTS